MTPDQLRKVAVSLTEERATVITQLILDTAAHYQFSDQLPVLQMFVAQTCHESGEYKIKEENLRYKSLERLQAVWPRHFTADNEAGKKCVNDPQALGEYIYGSTSIAKSLGNRTPADGYALRGSGFLQMTGYLSMKDYMDYLKKANRSVPTANGTEDVLVLANLLRADDAWAMDAAGYEFMIAKHCGPLAMAGDLLHVTRRINGGTIGLESRQHYYALSTKYITEY